MIISWNLEESSSRAADLIAKAVAASFSSAPHPCFIQCYTCHVFGYALLSHGVIDKAHFVGVNAACISMLP